MTSGEELTHHEPLLRKARLRTTPPHTRKNRPATHSHFIQEGDPNGSQPFIRTNINDWFRYQTSNVSHDAHWRRNKRFPSCESKENQYGTFTKSTLEYEDCARIAHETDYRFKPSIKQLTKELLRRINQ